MVRQELSLQSCKLDSGTSSMLLQYFDIASAACNIGSYLSSLAAPKQLIAGLRCLRCCSAEFCCSSPHERGVVQWLASDVANHTPDIASNLLCAGPSRRSWMM